MINEKSNVPQKLFRKRKPFILEDVTVLEIKYQGASVLVYIYIKKTRHVEEIKEFSKRFH